ncbi:MAG: dethiobiotin synthase [Alphaproteobacteria bacterium]|nr:dethiobiotin synthase [Alphaproteobacteria bacterium]
MKPLFITATGTDIGKTWIATHLIAQWRREGRTVDACKPVVSGFRSDDEASDTALLIKALGCAPTVQQIDTVSPWRFSAPLSPDVAAAREGKKIDESELLAFCKTRLVCTEADYFLFEGVGGVMVPLNHRYLVLDWMQELSIPVLVVCGTYVGSINHTLLTLLALKQRGIVVAGLVVNETPSSPMRVEEMLATLARHSDVPAIGLHQLDHGEEAPSFMSFMEKIL